MTAERTLTSRLYEGARGHDLVDLSSGDFQFKYLTRQILLIGKGAPTVFHAYLIDDPETKIFTFGVAANGFVPLPLRVDVVKSTTTCNVIGLW